MKSNKLKNTREVTFKEDYKPAGAVIYAKGSTHFIHHANLETLKLGGAKFDSKNFDQEGETEKAKEAFDKSKK